MTLYSSIVIISLYGDVMGKNDSSWLNNILGDFDNSTSDEEVYEEVLEPIVINPEKKNSSGNFSVNIEEKEKQKDQRNNFNNEGYKTDKAREEKQQPTDNFDDAIYFEKLKTKMSDSVNRVKSLFKLDEYNIDDLAYDITEQIWSMDKDDLLNETDRNIDRVVFCVLSNMIGIDYSDFYCRNYKGVKQLILNCLNTSKYYQNEYIYNSAYVDSLTNEYLLKILIDESLVTKQNIYCRFDSDVILVKELIANKNKKTNKLSEIFDSLKLPFILISLASGSVPLLASSAYIFYLDRCDYETKKIIREEDFNKMNDLYPKQVFFDFDGKHSR